MVTIELVEDKTQKQMVKNIIENHHSYVPNNSSVGRRIDWLVYHSDYRNILGHEVGCIYEMSPEMEGTMLFFPSELHHEVYPFYKCDQERISISGNLMFDTRVCI